MASKTTERLLLAIVRTDANARLTDGVWSTRCLHCRSRHRLSRDGAPLTDVTVEHIIPQAWFVLRAAAALSARVDGPADLRNLALACRRCNNAKGMSHDKRGPADTRAVMVVSSLLDRRAATWRSCDDAN